ncbi:LuxR family transcriptional regulator [Oerskovia flava]|uniref:LuxR family transcriptional regulator n=1 Tax=Oerskovia flava TaxID=2986422 RepID=UPI002240369C|nr:LuxR family transcriptional regulator [Oerskovia sp. JB1-3-2]
MSQEPSGSSAVEELDSLLLDARYTMPRPRPGTVSRRGLIDTARSSGRPVVAVTAPAGYGKSTLLAEWGSLDERPVVWVSLEHRDDNPQALLTVLATAFSRALDGQNGLATDMLGSDASLLGRAAPRLASALRRSQRPFLLVLDDLHELRSAGCHDVLGLVIGAIPHGSQLVTASRDEQPHLPRLRAADEAVEILATDLALDVAATAHVLAAAQVPAGQEIATAVAERTEGWPVGVHLAALIARDDSGHAVTGTDRFIADYLQREAFSRLPTATRTFLRRTSVLDELSAPLCNAVLGAHDSQAHLRRLEAASTFLVPLDRRREWFRYHALFREFLLGELMTVEPEHADELRVRAADWFEANGSPARAVEQLLATPDRGRCVLLVTRIVMSLFRRGEIATTDRWLTALGDDVISGYPPLAVLAGYVAVYEGRPLDAERWGAFVDAASFTGKPADGTASFDSARAMYRALRCPEGPQQMLADTHLALQEEAAWSPWRDSALTLSGEAHLLVGDPEGGARQLEQAVEAALALGHADTLVVSEAQLAHLDMDRGRWDRAQERVERALRTIERDRMEDYPTSALAFAAAARLSLHHGEPTRTQHDLTRGMRARTLCSYAFPTLAVRVRLHLARTSRATADAPAARHLLREVDDVLLHRPDLGLLTDAVDTLRGELDGDGRAGASGGGPPLTPAELRLLPYLQTHLTIREIGERLFVSRNTASSEIGSIYRKLGVSSRSDAVRLAVARGLLGE